MKPDANGSKVDLRGHEGDMWDTTPAWGRFFVANGVGVDGLAAGVGAVESPAAARGHHRRRGDRKSVV